MTKLAAIALLGIAVAGCQSAATSPAFSPMWGRFYLESTEGGAMTVVLPQSGVQVAINPKPVFAENDVSEVDLVQVDLGKCLRFQLNPAAARDLYRLSASNQGRRLVLMINGRPVGARRLDGALADGTVFTFVEVPDAELPALVDNMKKSVEALKRELARK